MIFVRYPFPCASQNFDPGNVSISAETLRTAIEQHLKYSDFSLMLNGKKLHGMEVIPQQCTVHVLFSLPGGKGGFGSMLRAIGAQIEKTTNREACRDLSGRRLRDINEEQRLKKWISKEAEREAEKIKRRQARIERLKTKAPHNFFDYEYEKEISQLPDRIHDALSEGLQKAKNPKKRPLKNTDGTKLPKKSWMDDLPLSSSDSDSEDKKEAGGGSSPSKRQKKESNDYTSSSSETTDSFEPQPCSSKQSAYEESDSCDTFMQSKNEEDSFDSVKNDSQSGKMAKKDSPSSSESCCSKDVEATPPTEKSNILCGSTSVQQPVEKDESPIVLVDFEKVTDLESLGLERLKSALVCRGLKCGGTLSDRAQRLWKVRDLQPHEYPPNLLAKSKK